MIKRFKEEKVLFELDVWNGSYSRYTFAYYISVDEKIQVGYELYIWDIDVPLS